MSTSTTPPPATLVTVPPRYVSSRTTPPLPPKLITLPPLYVSTRTTPPPTEEKKEEETSSIVPTTLTATPPNDEEEKKEEEKTSTAPTTECSNGSGNTEEKDPKRLKINNLPFIERCLSIVNELIKDERSKDCQIAYSSTSMGFITLQKLITTKKIKSQDEFFSLLRFIFKKSIELNKNVIGQYSYVVVARQLLDKSDVLIEKYFGIETNSSSSISSSSTNIPLEAITSSNHKRGRGRPKKRTRASMEEELEENKELTYVEGAFTTSM